MPITYPNRTYTSECAHCGEQFIKRNSRRRAYCSLECSFQAHLQPTATGCIEWAGKISKSYGYGIVSHNKLEKRAHRYAWERVHGTIPQGMNILHECDNPPCVNIAHLRCDTQTQNIADAASRGRMRRGVDHHNAKLTTADILTIRRRARAGETRASIAKDYGVVSQTIDRIVNGQRWGWVKDHQA